jgi:hypothetical protein
MARSIAWPCAELRQIQDIPDHGKTYILYLRLTTYDDI